MATANTLSNPELAQSTPGAPGLLVSLASLPHEAFDHTLQQLAQAFPGQSVVVATPDTTSPPDSATAGPLQVVGYTPLSPTRGAWTLTAADFLNLQELSQQYNAGALLILGAEAQSLEPQALRAMAQAITADGCDLAVPQYTLPPRSGLVNSAILYPVTRALFAARPRYPLALDLGLSPRMAARLAAAAQRFTATNQPDALIWPLAEAAVAGFGIAEVEAGARTLPTPHGLDLNTVLAQVAGSLFADVDAKAAFWQRARPVQPMRTSSQEPSAPSNPEEVHGMIDSFRLAYTNLAEIWSLVLPPHSLLGLKRLSVAPVTDFRMGDSLWARIVYDFLLAYRLRTINRGHLLGALTPLYLAWVASHILLTDAGTESERHIEAVAAAFEADKPYLVSRWRWPDRFNP